MSHVQAAVLYNEPQFHRHFFPNGEKKDTEGCKETPWHTADESSSEQQFC